MILELTDDEGHQLRVAGNPIKLPHDGEQNHTFPPRLAQHTHEVMRGVLGLSEQEILSLETRGVLRSQNKSEAP
jgi:crotonobetainyl-CoA:carnitine CoA-transferase CaiB-like acyl-CoA transferase